MKNLLASRYTTIIMQVESGVFPTIVLVGQPFWSPQTPPYTKSK